MYRCSPYRQQNSQSVVAQGCGILYDVSSRSAGEGVRLEPCVECVSLRSSSYFKLTIFGLKSVGPLFVHRLG